MKQYKLIYNPEEKDERYIFSNIDFERLAGSVSIQREEAIQEEEHEFAKKKSEIVEYESEEYKALKDAEQAPYIVTDSESRMYSGKLHKISETGSQYFVFINMGTYLKVIPVSKWYGFVQKNQFSDGNIDGLEKNLEKFEYFEDEKSESTPEIDYEMEFDDDEEDAQVVRNSREKKLSTSGKELQGLMENYEEDKKPKAQESVENQKEEMETKKIKTNDSLTKDELKKIVGKNKISIKDLLRIVKQSCTLGEAEKTMIKEFIHESCSFEVDSTTNEKLFKLKK